MQREKGQSVIVKTLSNLLDFSLEGLGSSTQIWSAQYNGYVFYRNHENKIDEITYSNRFELAGMDR